MKILAVDTSADDTTASVVSGMRVLSHMEASQIDLHSKWGGIFPTIAKRAHQEKIDYVVKMALKKAHISHFNDIDAFAVTYGPGLAIALEVGIKYIKELAVKYNKPIVPVNHMEGHLISSFVKNKSGNPAVTPNFPVLGLLVSGGHTELVYWKDYLEYEILGETLDDACGEALDKASKMLGFSYPGGPVIESLARQVKNVDKFVFPRPMSKTKSLDFSFSGLKTALLYKIKTMSEKERIQNQAYLSSSFQEAVFKSILKKTKQAIEMTGVKELAIGGGVSVNERLRYLLRNLATEKKIKVYFPPLKYLNFDNASMIGVVASLRFEKGLFINSKDSLDRVARLSLNDSSVKNV